MDAMKTTAVSLRFLNIYIFSNEKKKEITNSRTSSNIFKILVFFFLVYGGWTKLTRRW